MKYLAFDSTRYKTGGKYTIRESGSFKVVATGVKAESRAKAAKKYKEGVTA